MRYEIRIFVVDFLRVEVPICGALLLHLEYGI